MSAAMVEALTTLACASPANCFFQVSKPAAVLPHCRISTKRLALGYVPFRLDFAKSRACAAVPPSWTPSGSWRPKSFDDAKAFE
jgi:hypothetical protein